MIQISHTDLFCVVFCAELYRFSDIVLQERKNFTGNWHIRKVHLYNSEYLPHDGLKFTLLRHILCIKTIDIKIDKKYFFRIFLQLKVRIHLHKKRIIIRDIKNSK